MSYLPLTSYMFEERDLEPELQGFEESVMQVIGKVGVNVAKNGMVYPT